MRRASPLPPTCYAGNLIGQNNPRRRRQESCDGRSSRRTDRMPGQQRRRWFLGPDSQAEARREAEREPVLVSFLFASVLGHTKLEDGLGVILANKLQTRRTARHFAARPDRRSLGRGRVDPRRRSGPICWRRARAIRRRGATPSRSSITRAFTRCRPTASPTGSGSTSGMAWPPICRIAFPRRLASTSIPRRGSARA